MVLFRAVVHDMILYDYLRVLVNEKEQRVFMIINKNEEYFINNFFKQFESAKNSDLFRIEWSDGSAAEVSVDTTYEDDNGLELDDVNYEEYWSVAVEIRKIYKKGMLLDGYNEGDLF